MKRWLYRISLLLIITLFAIYLFHTGKIHSISLDNKDTIYNGIKYSATRLVTLSIDNKDPISVNKGSQLLLDNLSKLH